MDVQKKAVKLMSMNLSIALAHYKLLVLKQLVAYSQGDLGTGRFMHLTLKARLLVESC